jgi:hypothetical protein
VEAIDTATINPHNEKKEAKLCDFTINNTNFIAASICMQEKCMYASSIKRAKPGCIKILTPILSPYLMSSFPYNLPAFNKKRLRKFNPDPNSRYLLRTIPGVGQILAPVILPHRCKSRRASEPREPRVTPS